jgi:hypothetical protein
MNKKHQIISEKNRNINLRNTRNFRKPYYKNVHAKFILISLLALLAGCGSMNRQPGNYLDMKLLFKDLAQLVRKQSTLPDCPQGSPEKWENCFGEIIEAGRDGYTYIGEFGTQKNRYSRKFNGIGVDFFGVMDLYTGKRDTAIIYYGQWKNGEKVGLGRTYRNNGDRLVAIYSDDYTRTDGILFDSTGKILKSGGWVTKFGKHEIVYKIDTDKFKFDGPLEFSASSSTDKAFALQKENEIKPVQKKHNGINIEHAQIGADGSFILNVKTNTDTASLKINGTEHGGSKDGLYSIRKVARAGQETIFTVVATDINGNTETKTITVNRPIPESQAKFAALNPAQVKKQPERDAVAIIIGIADYKNLPRADFANDDASVFYDYAIRALGIKPENIKLLVDGNADDVAIYQAFKTWLPSRVRSTTDVYVYYSGHGLPAEDGQGLYLLPQRAHRDLIEKTAISQRELNDFIQAARPKSVIIFLDSCYSGLARTGETLLASARPVALKADKKVFPDEFTVITASQADQISSSSPDLRHGIFSYYLMLGMEGEADTNRDGKITTGEMHGYLTEKVTRQASMMNRRQEPQLVGDVDRVLIGQR